MATSPKNDSAATHVTAAFTREDSARITSPLSMNQSNQPVKHTTIFAFQALTHAPGAELLQAYTCQMPSSSQRTVTK